MRRQKYAHQMHIARRKVISRYVVSEASESEAGSLIVTHSPIEIKSSNASFYAAVYGWRFGRIVDSSRFVGNSEVMPVFEIRKATADPSSLRSSG
jgi:hypothetical protein